MPPSTILITGSNSGLGFEAARQLALPVDAKDGTTTTTTTTRTKKIILACRNLEKARAAQTELEELTGQKIFDILQIDVGNLAPCKQAAENLAEPVDGIICVRYS